MSIRFKHALALIALIGIGLASSAAAAPLGIVACTTLTVPGSYIVSKNLTAAGGDCLVVASDFVTIDLDGFVISSTAGAKGGSGVAQLSGKSFRGIAVRNGTITGFAQAILLPDATGAMIERIRVIANSGDGIVAGNNAVVRDSVTVANGDMGISLGQTALVTRNTSEENGGGGISVDIGGNVAGNTVGRNKLSGISTGQGANVVNNVSRNNGIDGIFMDCPSAVIANTTSNNLGQNLHLLEDDVIHCVNEHNSSL
jgi:hypothetical protein